MGDEPLVSVAYPMWDYFTSFSQRDVYGKFLSMWSHHLDEDTDMCRPLAFAKLMLRGHMGFVVTAS